MLIIALLWMPDSYRIHPRLAAPDIVFLRRQPPPQRTDICFIGDCAPLILPWPGIKRGAPLSGSAEIVPVIREMKVPPECRTFIVMSGTYLLASGEDISYVEADTQKIVEALKGRWPTATVHVIPQSGYNAVAREHSTKDDGWHLDDRGHEILFEQYSHLWASVNDV